MRPWRAREPSSSSPTSTRCPRNGAGHGAELELRAIRSALVGLPHAPGFLSLNVSPATILLPDFTATLLGQPLERLVLEITEHTQVSDYGALGEVLAPLRAAGLRIAVDDVGARFASMRHVLAPELIKLDLGLVHGISHDVRRRSLVAATKAGARPGRRRGGPRSPAHAGVTPRTTRAARHPRAAARCAPAHPARG